MKKLLSWTTVVMLPLVVCGGVYLTRRDTTERNLEYPTQMQYSPAYLSQTTNPVLPGGATAQMPVEGTVARGFLPFRYGEGEAEAARAGRELRNPLVPTPENLWRGQQVYSSYCAVCHGGTGGGDGAIIPKYPNPPSYKTESSKAVADGTMFHIITRGRKDMPSHAAQVSAVDRWRVILYIRQLQGRLEGGAGQ